MKMKDFVKRLEAGFPVMMEKEDAVRVLNVCFKFMIKALYEMGYEIIRKENQKR